MIRVRFCVLHSRHARVLLRVRAGLPRGKAALRPFAHDGSRHLPRERITRYVADAHGRDARNPGGVPKPEFHRRHNPFDMRSTHPPPPPPHHSTEEEERVYVQLATLKDHLPMTYVFCTPPSARIDRTFHLPGPQPKPLSMSIAFVAQNLSEIAKCRPAGNRRPHQTRPTVRLSLEHTRSHP